MARMALADGNVNTYVFDVPRFTLLTMVWPRKSKPSSMRTTRVFGDLATLTTELVELAGEEVRRETPEPVDLADGVESAITRVRMRAPTGCFENPRSTGHRRRPAGRAGTHGRQRARQRRQLEPAGRRRTRPAGVRRRRTCRLRIIDDGPGIDGADRPQVFDRFYRATAARFMPGSGLGLAVVTQTATQHVSAAEATPNTRQGTVIALQLPTVSPSPERLSTG